MHAAHISEEAMRRPTWKILVPLAVIAIVGVLAAGRLFLRERPTFNLDEGGLAMSGYDPVSYFPEGGGRPQVGDARFEAERDGRRYRFASEANRERFLSSPERYEPAFGGWCTYAVAHGYKFEVDPESYLVEGDRLLLFYRGTLGDARGEFEKEGVAAGVRQADANWPGLAKE
jgi:YHS domain-containing protein